MNMMGEKDRFNRQVSTSSTELDVINPLSWELEKKKKGFAFLTKMPLTQLWVESIYSMRIFVVSEARAWLAQGRVGTLPSSEQHPVPTPPLGQELQLFQCQSLSKAVATGCLQAGHFCSSRKPALSIAEMSLSPLLCPGNSLFLQQN